ncbi:hypothetical protein ACOI1C_10620 [Bacillus sp. DJP31]|uniref:hypothetical protein n=1 Tax=Bacillus sp. DJP31 TaxID=3409789 RepID=UPI003BB55B58
MTFELSNRTMKKVTDLYYADQIKNIRNQYGLTQDLFAKIMNWGIATSKRYETKKSTPDSTHLHYKNVKK